MKLLLTAQSIATAPGAQEIVWFLDLQEGNRLTSLCNGPRDYCLAESEQWAKRLCIDGSEKHRKLQAMGCR